MSASYFPISTPHVYFCRFLDLVYQTTSLKYNIVSSLFFFMSSYSCAHAALDFQTCAINSISCFNLVFLHPVFRHFISDHWSDQSSARFQVCVRNGQFEIFIFNIQYSIFNFTFWLLFCFRFCIGSNGFGHGLLFLKQVLNLALVCPPRQFIHHSNFTWGCFVLGPSKMGSGQAEQHCSLFVLIFLNLASICLPHQNYSVFRLYLTILS